MKLIPDFLKAWGKNFFAPKPKHQCVSTLRLIGDSAYVGACCIHCGYENHTFLSGGYPYAWYGWKSKANPAYCSKSPVNATWREWMFPFGSIDCMERVVGYSSMHRPIIIEASFLSTLKETPPGSTMSAEVILERIRDGRPTKY